MKLTDKILIGVVIFLIAIVAEFLYINYAVNYQTAPAEKNTQQSLDFKISEQKISDGTKPFKIDITYPVFSGAVSFNKLIKDAVDKEVSEFKKNSLENDKAIKDTDPDSYAKFPREYYLSISYTAGKIDAETQSIVLNVENFEGGAHGAHYPIAINFDVKNNKEIKLADLFAKQKDYLQKISEYCKKDLEKQITEKSEGAGTEGTWIDQGAGPKEENFSIFLINKDNSIMFYFPEYQVAPYVYGQFTVTMPK